MHVGGGRDKAVGAVAKLVPTVRGILLASRDMVASAGVVVLGPGRW